MKGRPRSVEREVAAHLSRFFVSMGWSPVERIPVLGRTGPDISINEARLVVDVKSRKEVPKSVKVKKGRILDLGNGLIGVRLDQIAILFRENLAGIPILISPPRKAVLDYWQHMDEWTQANCPEGVSALVLHRPGNGVHNSTLVIHSLQRSMLYGKTKLQRTGDGE